MTTTDSTPRVLIVDNDTVSARLLEAAVVQSDCGGVTAFADGAELAADGIFDLLMFADVLERPAPLQCIASIVTRHLPHAARAMSDDNSALAAIGCEANALLALHGLLALELEQLEHDLTYVDLATKSADSANG